jgi:NADP-dependent 3-hydroxy acid dehydrogenase YdfG
MARILITGASSGIGRATAIELASRGHDVVATARRPEALADLPVAARLQLDVTDQGSVDAAIAAAGSLDVLVSNAGETIRGSVEALPLSEYQRMMELNFLGSLRVTKAVLPAFRAKREGRIVLVSSILGRIALPFLSGYAASKFALEAVAEALAIETRGLGIHVSVIEPGRVATDGPGKAPTFADDHSDYGPVWEAFLKVGAGDPIEAAEVATLIADTVENPDPALRIPAGAPAQQQLAALHAAPTDRPFDFTRRHQSDRD